MSETPVKDRPADATPDKAPPPQLGPYRLVKRLGGGGMGHIYLAEQPSVGRQVAIKVLPPEAFDDTSAIARFQREIQILGKLSHPNICPVLEAGVDASTHYYVMELIRGIDLAKVVRTQRMDPRRSVEIAVQIGRALVFAHQNGVIHRDVKPLNVMLSRGERRKEPLFTRPASSSFVSRLFSRKPAARKFDDSADAAPADPALPSPGFVDRVTLIDFGLARQGRKTSLTATGEMVGTPAYMSPEQARGDTKNVSLASDIYSLGATLYEMLTLQPPFSGESLPDILMKVVTADPHPPSKLNPQVDRDLETIVLKAMEKEPHRRYASAASFVADLEHWLAGEAIAARRASFVYRLRKRVARHKLATSALALAVATLATLGGTFMSWYTAPGILSVDTVPSGADVVVNGRSVGRTPLQGARLPPGLVQLQLRLADHDTITDAPLIERGKTTHVSRQFRHEQGRLTLSSEPPGLAITASGHHVTAPVTDLALDTGTYRARVEGRNCFPRSVEFRLENGRTTNRHLTLSPMLQWRHDGGTMIQNAIAADVNEDGHPDLVVSWTDPPHVAALDGPTGHVLWHVPLPPSTRVPLLCMADLDGDLGPEVLCSTLDEGLDVYAAATGRLLRRIDARRVIELRTMPDLDGNGWGDILVAYEHGGVAALDGLDGRPIWRVARAADRLAVARFNDDGIPDIVTGGGAWPAIGLDGRTGRELWRGHEASLSTPVPADLNRDGIDDVVYLVEGSMCALDGRTGRPLWEPVAIGAGGRGCPTIADLDGDGELDIVKAGPDIPRVSIVAGRSGRLLREFENLPTGWGPPAVCDVNGDGRLDIICGIDSNNFVAIDALTGHIHWRFVADRGCSATPLLADFTGDGRQDLAASWGGTMAVLAAEDPPLLWKRIASAWELHVAHPVGQPVRGVFLSAVPAMFVDAADGAVRKEHPTLGPVSSVDSAGRRACVLGGGTVTLLNLESMTPIWTVPHGSHWTDPPLFVDANGDGIDDVCVRSGTGAFSALDGRDGHMLWSTPVALKRAEMYTHMTFADGLIYVCAGDGVYGVRASDGAIAWSFTPGDRVTDARVSGDLLICATGSGRLFALRRPPAAPEGDTRIDAHDHVVWRADTPGHHVARSLAVQDRLVVTSTTDGAVLALDRDTGGVRWTTRLFETSSSGFGLHDVDGDGWLDAAVATTHGKILVLSGADGRALWRYDVRSETSVGPPTWADLDGDGAAELLLISRDCLAFAFRVRLDAREPVFWPTSHIRSQAEAARATRHQKLLSQLAEAIRQGASDRVPALAADDAPAAVSYHAAMLAARRGDDTEAIRHAERGHVSGCRRPDLELLRCSGLGADEGARELARVLATVPVEQLLECDVDARRIVLWLRAADAMPAERAVFAYAAAGDASRTANSVERARSAGADPGLLLIARARGSVAAGQYADARRDIIEARRSSAASHLADREDRRLDALAEESLKRGIEAVNAARPEARALLEKATALRPDQPHAWYALSWALVNRSAAPRADAPRAVECARRSVELTERRNAIYLDMLAAAHFAAGDAKAAVAVQKEAVALEPSNERFRQALQKYQAAPKE